jgi:hypothetical protein
VKTWVNRIHGNVSHCIHGISYKEICAFCWEPKKMSYQQPSVAYLGSVVALRHDGLGLLQCEGNTGVPVASDDLT